MFTKIEQVSQHGSQIVYRKTEHSKAKTFYVLSTESGKIIREFSKKRRAQHYASRRAKQAAEQAMFSY